MRTANLRRPMLFAFVALFGMASVSSADDDPIQNAIKKGAKYLQGIHKPGQGYNGGSHGMGSATLAGLALLEAGIPDTDPALQTIAKYVRDNALAQTATYEISLTIMFLDQLGKKSDRPTIQMLGIRLMAGQVANGGWSYDCGNPLTAEEETQLKKIFADESQLVSGGPAKKGAPKIEVRPDLPPQPMTDFADNVPPAEKPKDEKPTLYPVVAKWFNKLVNNGKFGGAGDGDNSNTQFATLGLWCARKHGVPCDRALAALNARFRTSQSNDGGWDYRYQSGGGGSTATMTCAGLIALAVAKGSTLNVLQNKVDKPDPAKKDGKDPIADDRFIKQGLKCLGNFITGVKGAPEGLINRGRQRKRFGADNLNSNLYFLWSLERVAVIYGLETIGNHDWYTWGADALVDAQRGDGSWTGGGFHGANEEINTCFSLLFLCRANVARDLSTALKGKIKDPGVSILRGGGDIGKDLPNRPAPKTDPVAVDNPSTPNPPPATQTPQDFDAESAKLANAVINATPEARPALLALYRDAKGSVYTEALARAAGKLTGEPQQQTQESLRNV